MPTQQTILSPVTGVVFDVLAQSGQRLAAGAEVLVIESMKMEIPVVMPAAGVVRRLCVQAGDSVTQAQVVAEFEAAS